MIDPGESGKTQPNDAGFAGTQFHPVMRRCFCPGAVLIYCGGVSPNNRFVESVFHVRELVRHAKEKPGIRFVLGEKKRGWALAKKAVFAQLLVTSFDHRESVGIVPAGAQVGSVPIRIPAPSVAKPEGRQEMERSALRAMINCRRPNRDIVLARL